MTLCIAGVVSFFWTKRAILPHFIKKVEENWPVHLQGNWPKTRTMQQCRHGNTTTLGTPQQPTWLPTRNIDTQGEPQQGCHTGSSSSLLHELATPTSPATSWTELHKRRRSPSRSMPPIGHTRQGQTTPNHTTSFTRELCRSCADRAPYRPPAAGHRCHGDTAPPTPQQHGKQENPSDTPGKTD
jgi:hypothetical protein